ncbi:MAG: ABC transporter permease, partial [Lachnospiraceae bacterium]|nr:ABC transporter permease [Lachnospiraceae bacterium]
MNADIVIIDERGGDNVNVFRRSYLSIIDKRKRNVILLSVFFVLFVILFIVFFAYVSTENQISFIQKSLDSMIMVHKENVDDSGICSFTDDDIESIKETDNVKAVNLLTYHEMELQNLTPYSENVDLTGEYDEAMKRVMESLGMSAYKEPDSQAFAVTSSEDSAFFTGSGFYLSKGKPITADDEGKNVVLISEEMASLNHLTVGDTVEIKLPYMDRSMGMSSTSLNLKVKGIFHWESISESPKSRTASPGNFLFIPEDLLRANYALYPAIVYVFSEDGFLLDDTVKGLQDKLGETSIDQDQQQGRFVYKWDTSWGKEIGESLMEVRKVTAVILLFFV